MTSAYIFHGPRDGELLDKADFRLRTALEAVAGGRDFKVEDAQESRFIAIVGCRAQFQGKAVAVSEKDAEGLVHALADAMGCRHERRTYSNNFQVDGKPLGGADGMPAAAVYVLA